MTGVIGLPLIGIDDERPWWGVTPSMIIITIWHSNISPLAIRQGIDQSRVILIGMVGGHMVLQLMPRSKAHLTKAAPSICHAHMSAFMHFVAATLGKSTPADFTLVGFLTCVYSFVGAQGADLK